MKQILQIKTITLKNFKNVAFGTIDFKNCILGIYGQNGSGKTALVDAVDFLKKAVTNKLDEFAVNYIMCGKETAELSFIFSVSQEKTQDSYELEYCLTLSKNANYSIEISSEIIFEKLPKKTKKKIIEFNRKSSEKWLNPISVWKNLFENKDLQIKLHVIKEITARERRSFIFSSEFLKLFENNYLDDSKKNVFHLLRNFALKDLFVVKNNGCGPFNIDFAFPFNFKHIKGEKTSSGIIPISLQKPTIFEKKEFELIQSIFNEMNIVLQEIVPELNVVIGNIFPQQMSDGTNGVRFELLSKKGECSSIPLRYESEGIKKIISVLSLLISVYNNPSTFLAVDEMDAGIYEFLLGEILQIIEEKAKGRLLFTSHNLRPLEMLKKESLIFTTTNSLNRYVRLSGIQANNNPRNVYLRSISLGGQRECIYQETDHFKIDRAFRNAGKVSNDQK